MFLHLVEFLTKHCFLFQPTVVGTTTDVSESIVVGGADPAQGMTLPPMARRRTPRKKTGTGRKVRADHSGVLIVANLTVVTAAVLARRIGSQVKYLPMVIKVQNTVMKSAQKENLATVVEGHVDNADPGMKQSQTVRDFFSDTRYTVVPEPCENSNKDTITS